MTPLLALLSLFSMCAATTVSYKMAPHERACFYTEAKVVGEKIGFYFAVQNGGNFDVDFDVTDPNVKVILSGQAERQGDFVLTANMVGEYTFCFSNTMSTFQEKFLDFDITVQHEVNAAGMVKSDLEEAVGSIKKTDKDKPPEAVTKTVENLKNGLGDVASSLTSLYRIQRNIRTNEHRNHATVKATEGRIFWSAFLECVAMVAMAVGQVYVIQTFFAKSVRTRV
ncbi:hypothetical protein HDV03_003055 [Kappamyces sp. JEL0829]|nr:hypothetical protein HDV03_003055 [Kappamyces sp. JEL0829]